MAKKSRERRIKDEYERLIGILGEDNPKIETAIHLVKNAAFQMVTLEDLQVDINKNGVVETYQNGANQSGVKRSAAFDCYATTYKQYLATIKQLIDIAPEGSDTDDLLGFIGAK
jgi:hypothetical protein